MATSRSGAGRASLTTVSARRAEDVAATCAALAEPLADAAAVADARAVTEAGALGAAALEGSGVLSHPETKSKKHAARKELTRGIEDLACDDT